MYVPSKGLTKVDAAFNYTLKVKSITPNIGYYCYKKITNNSDRINLYFNISFKSENIENIVVPKVVQVVVIRIPLNLKKVFLRYLC